MNLQHYYDTCLSMDFAWLKQVYNTEVTRKVNGISHMRSIHLKIIKLALIKKQF